uniref:Uncharacterized protein n=1 Tax=Leptobrachium leishanense TaxID=445787 RepID=A0A8C5QC41_9ANUR
MAPTKTPKAADPARSGKLRDRSQDGGVLGPRSPRSSSHSAGEEAALDPRHLQSPASAPATGQQIQAMFHDLRSTIQDDFRTITASLHQEIRDIGERTVLLEHKSDNLCLAHNELVDAYKDLKRSHDALLLKVTDLEDRSRRNNIRIRGVPESIKAESLAGYLIDLFHLLLPEADTAALLLDRAHRLPKPRNLDAAIPRDVLTRIHFYHIKDSLMAAMRKAPGLPEIYAGISFFLVLSAATMQRRREFLPVTKVLRNHHIPYRWGFPLKLLVTYRGTMSVFHSCQEGVSVLQVWDLMGEMTPPHRAPPLSPSKDSPEWHRVNTEK